MHSIHSRHQKIYRAGFFNKRDTRVRGLINYRQRRQKRVSVRLPSFSESQVTDERPSSSSTYERVRKLKKRNKIAYSLEAHAGGDVNGE